MRNNLNSLSVDLLIVHDVPKKFSRRFRIENPDIDSEDIVLSEIPTEFDMELTRFFHDRITSTIGSSSAFEIEFDNATDSVVKEQIVQYFSNEIPHQDINLCISVTQEIAKELHNVQTARNPGGILLFIPCHNRDKHGIAVLKVEREEGVRIQRDSSDTGQTTFSMQHIKDLMLTKKTKLFKIALFYQNDENVIVGLLCDQQQGAFANREIANFFLVDFLGCKLKEEPSVTTKKFFETTARFINDSDMSPEEKINVHTHLISELTNNNVSINSLSFARRALPPSKVQVYMDAMSHKNIAQTFSKDIVLVSSKIKKVQYEFDSGIKLIGNEDIVKEKLNINSLDTGESKVEFTDILKRVDSK